MTLAAAVAAAPLRRGMMNNAAVGLAQLDLRKAGAELDPDGDFGGVTEIAVKQFQRTHGLADSGVIDVVTAAALDALTPAAIAAPPALPSVLGIAPWLSVMRAITGTKEFAGSADSPIILGWVKTIVETYPDLKDTVGWYNHDSIPWCGLGVGYALTKSGFRPPKMLLGAANYLNAWPDGYRLNEPCPGAILVKTRTGGGHVTLYECEDDRYYYCRGANQSDMVNVAPILKDDTVRGFMWPKNGPVPGKRLIGTTAAAVAGSEA